MSPEIDDSKRCKLYLRTDRTGRVLSLVLKSEDVVPLRAAFNTNLRLATSALKSIGAVRNRAFPNDLGKD